MKTQLIRRLIPAAIVAGVLAFSYWTPVPAFVGGAVRTMSTAADHGYGNNCGRFGYGTHDHGKVCKHSRPPGQTGGGDLTGS